MTLEDSQRGPGCCVWLASLRVPLSASLCGPSSRNQRTSSPARFSFSVSHQQAPESFVFTLPSSALQQLKRAAVCLVFACTKVTAVFSDWNVVDQTPDPLSLLGSVPLIFFFFFKESYTVALQAGSQTTQRVCPPPPPTPPPTCKARPVRAQASACAAGRISHSTLGHHALGLLLLPASLGWRAPRVFPQHPTCGSPRALLPQQPARTGRWQHTPGLCS